MQPPDGLALEKLGKQGARSQVVNLEFAVEVTGFKATLCLLTEMSPHESKDDFTLAYYDEAKGKWVAQDSSLKEPPPSKFFRDAQDLHDQKQKRRLMSRSISSGSETVLVPLCGTTNHFTNFAVLLGGAGPNQSSEQGYITKSWKGDAALTATLCGLAVLVVVVVISIYFTKMQFNKKKALAPRTTRVSDFSYPA